MVLLLFALLLAIPARAAADYKDVPKNHWAYESIERTAELGLIGGVGGGAFGLGREITRAEYAAMLCRLMGWQMITPELGSFTDNLDMSAWYYSAVETAYANGALHRLGSKAGVLETMTREELASMTVRALGYASLSGVVQDDCPFPDVSTNRGYITLAYQMGFMSGNGKGVFQPAVIADREQAATVLLRVYDAMHADVREESAAAAPRGAVIVEPLDDRDGSIPMCPRAPLENVHDAALKAGRGGTVALQTAAYNTADNRTVKPAELDSLLAAAGARVHRSTRYESSYLSTRGGSIVWFESAEDIAEKVMLCRLMGISTVCLIR